LPSLKMKEWIMGRDRILREGAGEASPGWKGHRIRSPEATIGNEEEARHNRGELQGWAR
jgi:hypothetical protein